MKKIRTAILGYGRSGSTLHAGPIEKNGGFDLVAVCDLDPARRAEAAQRFGCVVYEDYHAMLKKEELDLVCVVTRNHQHCEMACDCLKGYGDEYEVYEDIAAALRGECEFAVTPNDALELSRVLDAIRTSSAENRVVHL